MQQLSQMQIYKEFVVKDWLENGVVYLVKMTRQQDAFFKESSKYKGCGILKRNFYTRFIPIFKDFGL